MTITNSAIGELFMFKESDLVFTQTSGTQPVIYNGDAYEPRALAHADFSVTNDITKQKLDVTMALTNPVAQRYFAKPVDNTVTLDVYQQDVNGTNIMWKGRLTTTRQVSATEVALTFESIFTSLRRPGLRARYQRTCRVALYGKGCNLNPEDWKVPTQVQAMNGLNVTVGDLSAYDSARFRGGMIRAPDSTLRFILSQNGNVLTLSRPWDTLNSNFAASGYGQGYGSFYGALEVTIYPGCNHNTSGCDSFDNILNYRGFPWIPTRNPFQNAVA